MEDVLDLYAQPYDSRFPVVCFDESPYQLVGEVRQPQPSQPGKPQRKSISPSHPRGGSEALSLAAGAAAAAGLEARLTRIRLMVALDLLIGFGRGTSNSPRGP